MDRLARVREFAQPLARAEGVDLLDVALAWEGRQQVLRLTIERPDGPTSVVDCEAVSRSVGAALDAQDLIPHHYVLEVASAGLTRPLRNLADFHRTIGKLVRIVRRSGSGPVLGTLVQADEQGLAVEVSPGQRLTIPLEDVAAANREIAFGPQARPARPGSHA
jgi:ribosome maturation factor RimP